MCGIYGFFLSKNTNLKSESAKSLLTELIKFSESRGKEASGISFMHSSFLNVYKAPVPGTQMMKYKSFQDELSRFVNEIGEQTLSVIGHSRLVTNGTETEGDNNQPVIGQSSVAVHNGIIVNGDYISNKYTDIQLKTQLDTEIFIKLFEKYKKELNEDIQALSNSLKEVEGTVSLAIQSADNNQLYLLTNNGSVYWWHDEKSGVSVFASEEYVLRKSLHKSGLISDIGSVDINRLNAHQICIFDELNIYIGRLLPDVNIENFKSDKNSNSKTIHVSDLTSLSKNSKKSGQTLVSMEDIPLEVRSRLEVDYSGVDGLRRCTCCILPETMPFISFDENGECNYCKSYKKRNPLGKDKLEEKVSSVRQIKNKPNCIVNLSGGRDSSYGLHYVKEVLGLNPIAYTYDWGMVTDLARRNVARLCGQLGVEHIVVSADIAKKREYIKKNVETWLKKPSLGMIPLFMAGDKQYFYYSRRLRQQTGIDLIFTCRNDLEKTHFKSGFAGIMETPDEADARSTTYDVSFFKKMRIASYYVREFLSNPGYLNSSLLDTASAFYSSYLQKHDFLYLYDYILWDEDEINKTLAEKYDWEKATDTKSTWRIGDGTTAFYNYIYYTVAGFTENDTFLSNCIREGILSRDVALQIAHERNQPRFESVKWYCDILGLDFETVVKKINEIKRFY